MNTENSSMRLLSPSGTDRTHTELIARRLKAADPTIVLAPSSPGSCASQPHSPGLLSPLQGPTRLSTVSMTERRISGAEEPSARSVRFATVAFHTLTCTVSFSPVFSFTCVIIRFFEVMTSIADLRAWRKRVGGGVSRAGSRRRRARGSLLRLPHAHEGVRDDGDPEEAIHERQEVRHCGRAGAMRRTRRWRCARRRRAIRQRAMRRHRRRRAGPRAPRGPGGVPCRNQSGRRFHPGRSSGEYWHFL